MREAIVCEAGILWRRVLRRLEERVGRYLAAGWHLQGLEKYGVVRVCFIAVLERECPELN